jgi:hypothetical protein
MGKINATRVILGGLLAGLVINIAETVLNLFVFSADMSAMLKERNLPEIGGSAIGGFVVLCFLLGIVTVWLYAAIRPRYGAGPGTAITAALAVWFTAYIFPQVGNVLMGMYGMRLMVIGLLWGLGEIVLGALAGAYVYRE